MDPVRNTATASTQTNAALSRAVRERQVSDTRVGRLDLSRTNRADCVTLRHGGRIEADPRGAANQSPSGLAQLTVRPSTVTSWYLEPIRAKISLMSVPKLRPGTGTPAIPIPCVRSPTARPASFITSLPESPGSP